MKGIQLFQPDNRSLQIAVQSKQQRSTAAEENMLKQIEKKAVNQTYIKYPETKVSSDNLWETSTAGDCRWRERSCKT